jgi:uncharacterized membrane protein
MNSKGGISNQKIVAFVGVVSQINYLTEQFPWLGWINDIPSVILGVVTGLLPVVMLAILMALVPIVCRCKCIRFPFSQSDDANQVSDG